jgi:phosphohistidine phosphatase
MNLYLVRHAIAFDHDPATWPDDRDRPLTPQGEKRFRRAARGLAALAPSVDLVLSSGYVRAWRTAELLARDADWPAPTACEALESGRQPSDVLEALQPHADKGSAALVGHEPNLHQLASFLLTGDAAPAMLEFRKGGVALLQFDGAPAPGLAHLVWLLTPKVLRALK